jgi:hypothetical protein
MLLDEDVELIDNISPGVAAAGLEWSGIIKQEDQVILQQAEDPAAYTTATSCSTAEEATASAISTDQDQYSWADGINFPPLSYDDNHALHYEHDVDADDAGNLAGPILYDIDLW